MDGVPYFREHRLGPRNVVDFLSDGIVVEVKKGKPKSTAQVIAQVRRYAAFEKVRAIVIVVEGKLHWHPEEIDGKPVVYISLAKLWGVAL